MGLQTFKAGVTLHTAGSDRADTLEILVKGRVQIDNGIVTLNAGTGAILGLAETPGAPYRFTYTAMADAQIISYAYLSTDDIAAMIIANAKICPILASECVRLACEALNVRAQKYSQVQTAYENILSGYTEYPALCEQIGEYPESFDVMKKLQPPAMSGNIAPWEESYLRALMEHADEMRTGCYAVSPEIASGIILSTMKFYGAVAEACIAIYAYEEQLREDTAPFTSAIQLLRARIVERERSEALGTESGDAPAVENALDTILSYAAADPKVTEEFRSSLMSFRENPNRYATTDEARMTRRAIGKLFYEIYFAAFLRSMEHPEDVPSEVRMFFMFGFVDEVLAGPENTSMLYSIVRSYQPDPDGRVMTAYEWLQKIYRLEVEPSRNEFDQDYPTYLRELKTSGDATAEQIEQMKDDPKSRFLFEARNFFTIGGRVTFGHAASFVPFFDKLNAIRPLAKAYLQAEAIYNVFERIRGVDFGLFTRQRSYFNQALGTGNLFLDENITPYVVLTPIVGFRGSLWQEIEGKDRGTPARMLLPVVFTEEPDNCILRLAAEFRWEMCKTIQGVHWNDVSDPSLTALYCDYLQFYKKNRQLSEENKEKVKTTLKKYSNDYKSVFIGDYTTYVNFEAKESPRLNKVAREILFTFCPFPKALREKLADNPQYRELIKKYETQLGGRLRPLAGLINKLRKDNIEVPEEIIAQYQALQQ
ncbi:MAG: hypothetical protein IJQ21_11450 [Lachnospiraceae bacterium]|nr:hypothetical protein [Lachnospiraceae bacterium]